jgi:hypothetical protein
MYEKLMETEQVQRPLLTQINILSPQTKDKPPIRLYTFGQKRKRKKKG